MSKYRLWILVEHRSDRTWSRCYEPTLPNILNRVAVVFPDTGNHSDGSTTCQDLPADERIPQPVNSPWSPFDELSVMAEKKEGTRGKRDDASTQRWSVPTSSEARGQSLVTCMTHSRNYCFCRDSNPYANGCDQVCTVLYRMSTVQAVLSKMNAGRFQQSRLIPFLLRL